MKKLKFIFFSLLFLVSCADLQRESYLKEITQLQNSLREIEGSMTDARLSEISSIKLKTMQIELRIKQNLHLDTIDVELAKKLDAYKIMRRSIKPMMEQFANVREGIKEEKTVLRNLRQDIKHGRGERQHYANYIRFEKRKVEQLNELSKDYHRVKEQFFQDYERLYPPIEALSESLLSKNQHQQ